MQPQPNQPPATAGQPPQGDATGAQAAQQGLNPDQLRKMQVMVKQAMGLLLEDTTAQQFVAQAKADPKTVTAQVVTTLLQRLYEAAQGAGQDVDMVTILVTGIQIIGTLAEMLESEGVIEQEDMPGFVAEVGKMAVEQHNAGLQQGGQPGAMQ